MGSLGRGPYEEHLFGLANFGPRVQEEISFEDFSIFSFGGHFVLWSQAIWEIFVGPYKEHLWYIILNLNQWLRNFFQKLFFIYSSGDHLAQWNGTIKVILVEGIRRNISVILNMD